MPTPTEQLSASQRLERLVARTTRLHRLTAHLSRALRVSEVAEIVVDDGTSALDAHSGAIWRLDPTTQRLILLRALKYPPEALATLEQLTLDPQLPIADAVVRCEPVWLSSRADYESRYPVSAARTREMGPQEYSVAALPIVINGHAAGVIAFTFSTEHEFDEDERTYLTFLALHCSQGLERARLYESETAARERVQFLAKASVVLGSSLDYEETLRNVASLAVPKIGDWCGVELVDPEDATAKQVAVAHVSNT